MCYESIRLGLVHCIFSPYLRRKTGPPLIQAMPSFVIVVSLGLYFTACSDSVQVHFEPFFADILHL